MELHAPARALRRLARVGPLPMNVRPYVEHEPGRPASTGCAPAPKPPCPPYVPPPPPACRALRPRAVRALRVLCCAPSQGQRPPCAPRAVTPSLTCSDANTLNTISNPVKRIPFCTRKISLKCETEPRTEETIVSRTIGCGEENDRVARRHALAELARRRDYEREVAIERAAPLVPPPAPTPFLLGGERECCVATDGRHYSVQTPGPKEGPRCGPHSRRSPPKCVTLAPDDGCQIRDGAQVDPCAHRPRILLEIDRSATADTPQRGRTAASEGQKSTEGDRAEGACGLTAKKKNTEGTGGARWCKNPPKPVAEPHSCRRPTLVERLRGRVADVRKPPYGRNFHTSTALPYAEDKSDTRHSAPTHSADETTKKITNGDAMAAIMRERAQLKEAGRGRVVVTCKASAALARAPSPDGGRLDLSIPAGAKRLRVTVSLDGYEKLPVETENNPSPVFTLRCLSTDETKTNTKSSSSGGMRDSWLSIKQIQKKLSGCCRNDEKPYVNKTGSQASPGTCSQTNQPKAGNPCSVSSKEKRKEKAPPVGPSPSLPTKPQPVARFAPKAFNVDTRGEE